VDLAEFLLGREPVWEDLTEGYAVPRAFEDESIHTLDSNEYRICVMTGTAGSGKSITLMRLALRYHAMGRSVLWINPESEVSIREIRSSIRLTEPDVLFLDDADMFGRTAASFLLDLANDNPKTLVIAGVRSTRLEQLNFPKLLAEVQNFQFAIPHLGDSDIDLLIDALSRANRLGRLRGLSREAQQATFRDYAGRQLIVAMIEATTGERFEDKLDQECRDLDSERALIYATVAVATSLRHYLTRDEVLLAIGDASNEAMNRIDSLVNQRLLTFLDGHLRVRHRVVADRAITYYRINGQLGEPLRGLLFAMATKVHPSLSRRSREWQLLIRLLNHDFLIRLAGNPQTIRAAYAEVETILSWDYHFWLQRGSLEVEIGDLRLAQNFLEQARSMAGDDPLVQTEWAYMMLKRASQEPMNPSAREWVTASFDELESAIELHGRTDPYPYHVMGSQGLSWVRRGLMSDAEKVQTLERLRSALQEAREFHPTQRDIQQLSDDLERAYLLLAVPADQRRAGGNRA